MADQFLTEIEREELLSKYKTENLRDAPANIKDSTLINNFGNDEQKQRLAASETANREEPKGTETETGDKSGEIKSGEETGGELKANNDADEKEFAFQFNEYVRLHGSAPDSAIKTSDELRALNATRLTEIEAAKSGDAPEPAPAKNGLETITLVNKAGDKITPTVYTYENFIKKTQPEWKPLVAKPKEIQK